MGACCDRERQTTKSLERYNKELKNVIATRIAKEGNSEWGKQMTNYLKTDDTDYLYTFTYDSQITELVGLANSSLKYTDTRTKDDQYKRGLMSSFIVPEDEVDFLKDKTQENIQPSSFSSQIQKNPSLMLQLDTIYKPFLEQGPYKQNAKMFLAWIEIAETHLENGFLEPFYRIMADYLIKTINTLQTKDSDVLMKKLHLEISGFVNAITGIYKQVYKIAIINKTPKGKLFKNQTINHFPLNHLFKTKEFMSVLRNALIEDERVYIQGFEMRLRLMEGRSFQDFKVPPKFQLISRKSILTESGSITNVNSYQSAITTLKKITSSKTPTSKLKILLQVQKQIIKQIYSHYSQLHQEIPEVEPEVINSLTMFVVVKSRVKQLPIDLRIIQTFASKNAMNSISGYYISTFNAAVSMIDSYQQQ